MTISIYTNIDVDNLASATEFYCSALGLVVGRSIGSSIVELRGGNSTIYLLEKAAGTPATPGDEQRRDYARHWTPVHLDFVVSNLDDALERAVQAGAQAEGPIRNSNWGRLALLADPFGNGFCLVEFLGRGYDEISH
jgi:predicted enzyme related to lactoylglutathione lyase